MAQMSPLARVRHGLRSRTASTSSPQRKRRARGPAAVSPVEPLEQRRLLTIANGGFEQDLAEWEVNPAPEGYIYTTPYADWYSAVEGTSLAYMWPGVEGVYSTLSQTFHAGAGATVSGWAVFVSYDSAASGNDDAHVAIKDASGHIVATPFEKSIATAGDYPSRTGWLYWEHVLAEAGTYTLEAAVRNVSTSWSSSQLGVDGIEVSEVASPNDAVTVDAGGPYTVAEGDGLYFGAIAIDGNGDVPTYMWDVNNDGQFDDISGQAPYVSWPDLVLAGINDGPGTYDIAVRANDRRGSTAVAHTTITVVNVPPQGGTLRGPDTVTDGSRAAYTASAWDPAGPADPLEYAWSVTRDEDGSTLATGAGTSFAFTPQDRGQYTVSLAVGDGDDTVTLDQSLSVVENMRPDIEVSESGYYADEGIPFLYDGWFIDSNTWDTSHRVTIDWGDGTEPTIFLPGAQFQDKVRNGYINPANGHAYYLLDPMNWPDAEAYAQSLGGHLVSINDQAEQEWVKGTFGRHEWGGNQTIWIGLTDSDAYTTDGNFVWTSGEPVTFTDWHVDEPNNWGGDEDFGQMIGGWGGEWNDSWHSYERAVIELDAPYQFPRGDQGYERYFQVHHAYADEGEDPRGNGPNEGRYTITATVTDEKGLSDSGQTEVGVFNAPAHVAGDYFVNVDEGKEADFHAYLWDSGVNDTWTVTVDYGDGSGVITLHPNQTGDLGLRHTYADQGSYVVRYTAQDNDSPEATVTESYVTVSNAAPTITRLSLTPSAVDDGQDVTLSALVGEFGDDTVTVLVDWGDGLGPEAFNPPAGPPQPFTATHAYAQDGTYNVTVTVRDEDGGEVVKTSAGQLPEYYAQWEVGNGGNGHIYGRAFVPEQNAYAAYRLAEELGGHLVTITSPGEQGFINDTFLFSYPYGLLYTSYWIGLSDAAEEGNFQWVTGEPLSFTNWRPGEPNDFWPTGEDFAVMNWHFSTGQFPSEPGDWNDVDEVHTGGFPPYYAIVEFNQAPPPLSVTVGAVGPAVDAGGDASAVEGLAFTRSGSFADAGNDAWAATVDYGDGSGTQALMLNADKSFDLSHVYADNGAYTVTVTVADTDDGLDGVATFDVAVTNAPPAVTVDGPLSGVRGQARRFNASVVDPGVLDTHAVSWRVLRGTTVVASGGGTVAEFTPLDLGLHTVEFTAVDNDGGVGLGSAVLDVKVFEIQQDPADPSRTVLAVGGTSAVDTVVVKPRNGKSVEVVVNDVVLGVFAPTVGVHVFGQDGNDHVIVTGALPVPVTFLGGNGDDILRSNNFSDVLIGGAGDDRVLGNAQNA